MLRMESDTGWWLISHPNHARLAGAFAAAWGNEKFRKPEPRVRVLHGISSHDDGWSMRDEHPKITREGRPSAFSTELVGKYSAFEEIDLSDYLAVRERAVRLIAERDPYAGLLIALHTYSLLTDHADRSTIAQSDLPMLDKFLASLRAYRDTLIIAIENDDELTDTEKDAQTILEHFRLLQACDNMSLLACVAYDEPSTLLHPLPLNDGTTAAIRVYRTLPGVFQLHPWPFAEAEMSFRFPACHVEGKTFASSAELEDAYRAAKTQMLSVKLCE